MDNVATGGCVRSMGLKAKSFLSGKVISLIRHSAFLNFAQQFQTFFPLERRNRRSHKQLRRIKSPLQAFGINHLPMNTAIPHKL